MFLLAIITGLCAVTNKGCIISQLSQSISLNLILSQLVICVGFYYLLPSVSRVIYLVLKIPSLKRRSTICLAQVVHLFHPVPVVDHVGRPADVVVLLDHGHILDQIQPGAEEPIIALRPLGIGDVALEPPLDKGVEAVVHRFRYRRVGLLRPQQRLSLVEYAVLVQHVANFVVVHVQPKLLPVVHEIVLISVAAGQPLRRCLALIVPHDGGITADGLFLPADDALLATAVVVIVVRSHHIRRGHHRGVVLLAGCRRSTAGKR